MPFLAQSRALAVIGLVLVFAATGARAGVTAYTEPGQTDFDTALLTLNPYGSWSKIDGLWAYTPFDHQAPYTNGRWLYTEYGWYWKGNLPHSWATEHYGYWKRGADQVWSWYPGAYWLPETVEIRETSTHIGWRSAAVDADGHFIEKPEDRWTKTDEWTFVTREQFANPITPSEVAKPDEAITQLENSTESNHVYVTYREIQRPGPHPADFVKLCHDGGMFAPTTLQDQLALQQAPPPIVIPGVTPGTTLTSTNADAAPAPPATSNNTTTAPSGMAPDTTASATPSGPAPSGLALNMNGAGAAANALSTPTPPAPPRKVKYWVTRCLPTYWTPVPPDAKMGDLYIYRPDFYQDGDGIARRVAIWLDPDLLKRTKQSLASLLGGSAPTKPAPAAHTGPATPAVPAGGGNQSVSQNPFRSSLDQSYQGTGAAPSSTKNPASSGATNPAPATTTTTQ